MIDTAGRRYTSSDAYQRARASGMLPGRLPPELRDPQEVLTGEELASQLHLRTYSDVSTFSIEGQPFTSLLPTTAPLPTFVETIPVTKLLVELSPESSEADLGSAVADGTPLPEAGVVFGQSPTLQKLPRVGITWPVSLGVLDEPGQVASILDTRLDTGIGLGLEHDIIQGNSFWPGALAQVTQSVAKGAGYRADAIVNGIAQVQGQGWYARPLQVVINPATRAATYLERDSSNRPIDVSGMLDDLVDAWVITNKIPPGTAIVGDWFGALGLFVKGPLAVSMSTEHVDLFVRGMAQMKAEFRAYAWLRQPNALCLVTGIT